MNLYFSCSAKCNLKNTEIETTVAQRKPEGFPELLKN